MIGDMQRLEIPLEDSQISTQYLGSTLVVKYPKPTEVRDMENYIRKKFEELNEKNPQEGDLECTTQ